MSLKQEAINAIWQGQSDFLSKIVKYAGSPDGAVTADFQGQFCYDTTNNNWYISTDGATAWTQVDA